ncbi:MAG TPA: methyl-accepting chemotaxis protein [Permianibacter sp.]|nr:methyl-accepting chemotaxis protein [Permianibacter sp.]
MFWQQKTLAGKLLVTVSTAMLALVLTIALSNAYAIRQEMIRFATTVALPSQVQEVRGRVENILQFPVTISAGMAYTEELHRFLAAGEPGNEQGAIQAYLARLKAGTGATSTYLVSGNSLNYYTETGLLKTLDRNNPRDGWFFGFTGSGKEFEMVVDKSQTSNQLVAYVNYALKLNGNTVAVVGIARTVDELAAVLRDMKVGESGSIFLVGRDSKIQLHRDEKLVQQPLDVAMPALAGQSARLSQSKELDVISIDSADGDLYVASVPLTSIDWNVIAIMPKQELLAPITKLTTYTLLFAAVIAVVALLVLVALNRRLLRPVQVAAEALNEIGKGGGDLRQRLPVSSEQETAMLAEGFNRFIGSLQGILSQVVSNATQVASQSRDLLAELSTAAEHARAQQVKTELVATAVNEMGSTVHEIARNASAAATAAKSATEESAAGTSVVLGTAANIDRLAVEIGDSAQSVQNLANDVATISNVLEVIRGISEQTNLLALNAAIEAARAGEQGRGFAVVADEVRNLAKRTQQSTEEIRNIIETLQRNASRAVAAMQKGQDVLSESVQSARQAGGSLQNIQQGVTQISDMNYQIAAATEEQSTVTEDINKNISAIADLSRQTSAVASRCQDHCSELDRLAEQMQTLMRQFAL